MMELSQPGPRRVYCVQDTYPKWSNTTHVYDRRAWEEAGSVPGREKDYEFKRAFLYDIEVVTI